MNLTEKFKRIKPRENSGSVASNRFDFQKNWAICKLIELTNSNVDFLLAFEYHEDIIVLDSVNNPTQIDFYQIKTKDKGSYSLKNILTRKKLKNGDGGSILGKLYQNKLHFEVETNSLNIVSNTKFNIKSIQENKLIICCNELHEDEKVEIENCLKSELSIEWLQDFFNIIFLHTSELTIEHHNEITKDKLNRLIETRYNAHVKYNPSLAYRTIFDEVNRRNNLEREIQSFDELINFKSISKADFEAMLKIVVSEPDKLDLLKNKLFNLLDAEKINLSLRKKYLEAWKDVQIQYLSLSNDFFNQCVEVIKKVIEENIEQLDGNLLESLDKLYKALLNQKIIQKQQIYSEYFLKMVILKEIYHEE
ncbi:dsDNA nuclease domain-containing protein [Chryseobacterium sp. C3]|uniref:dsDNA nuclease domain-containing protein n=1 Tax=Chryseobacterium sp. C3 TaxID=2761532 RepID=UPI0016277EA9|nr:dsDNA nuclease domain-containing protein [Chryseobacterium sp. C3]